jgi:hypothetical protein
MQRPKTQVLRLEPAQVLSLKPSVSLLGFFHFANLAPPVEPAMRADLVRQFRFVALGAFIDGGRLQRIVRAPLAASRLRVSAFGVGHLRSSRCERLAYPTPEP